MVKHSFKFKDGRIYLITNLEIWGGNVTNEIDVTEELTPIFNDYASHLAFEVLKALNPEQ